MNRTRLALPLMLLIVACGDTQPPVQQAPKLPPPELAPFLPTLKELSAAMPTPDERTQRELDELCDIALGITAADRRMTARAERSLLAHPEAWFVLEPALQHENVTVRRRAAYLCGRTVSTELQLPLLLRLKYESDPEAVVWVADTLQILGNDTGLLWLDGAMNNEVTAQVAGELAGKICGEREIELGDPPSWAELQKAMQALAEQWRKTGVGGRPGSKPPTGVQHDARVAGRLATTESTLLRPIDDARFVLTRSGKIALPLLERTLTASEAYLRTMALQVLAELGPTARQTGPAVTKLLTDPLTASYAVRTLGEIGERAALEHLRPMLDSIDTELRAAASLALGLLGDTQSNGALLARMQDAEETMDVRVGAAFALCCLGETPEARRRAITFLDERVAADDYHAPTLTNLRERLQRMGRN